jgi:hypothetical protein
LENIQKWQRFCMQEEELLHLQEIIPPPPPILKGRIDP